MLRSKRWGLSAQLSSFPRLNSLLSGRATVRYSKGDMTPVLQPATEAELPAIVALMNAAFRGSPTPQSWTTEASYITGDRTNLTLLRQEIAGGAHILLTRDSRTQELQGCASLRPITSDRWYLGALTVDPNLQNAGFGRDLLAASEHYATSHGARTVEMTVINIRATLIAWYERRGYRLTGETRPFPYGDTRFGTPTRLDLAFVVLEKFSTLSPAKQKSPPFAHTVPMDGL